MNQKNQHRTTIKDVARESGVSIATVSKIINGKDEHISQATRQRVFQTIDALGYVQNSMAKGLKESNTRTLGLVIPDISNAFPEMAKGAQEEAFSHGYTMLFGSADNNYVQEEKFLEKIFPFADPLGKGLRATGDVKFTTCISLFTTIGVRLVFPVLFAIILNMGVMGIAFAMCLDWTVRGIIFWIRFQRGKWKTYKVI